jgi:YHS domain-containing protein
MPGHEHAQDRHGCCAAHEDTGSHAIDPVCEMDVDRSSPPGGAVEVDGQKYYFCSTFCRAKFVGSRAGTSL